ncbi:hypothetical protein, partial [Burkholderia cenocepacia]|uniref:hypothetical protein n=1 Tax=Burkholderia cenocepacia TaxID=95486 RepID=UPI00223176EB
MKIHLVLCDPCEAVLRLTELVDAIGVGGIPSFQFKDLPALAIIVGEDGLPHWAATFYALDQALNSNSVTATILRQPMSCAIEIRLPTLASASD